MRKMHTSATGQVARTKNGDWAARVVISSDFFEGGGLVIDIDHRFKSYDEAKSEAERLCEATYQELKSLGIVENEVTYH